MPCSGLTGDGILESVGHKATWYTGLAFIPHINSLSALKRNFDGPFMMPIVDKYADMGAVVMGKVESGMCSVGETFALYPNKVGEG
jgi:peptide chain release factor subunit 3